MKTKGLLVSLTFALSICLAGCNNSEHDHSHHEHKDNASMPSSDDTSKAIKEELHGLDLIEKDVNKKDFNSAADQFESMHEKYHASVLPPIESENKKMGEDMHSKFDALEEAINSKDKTQILNNVKVNRESLKKAAKELKIQL
jgi:hypothetical protein